jgi:hypothetical protein
MVKDAEHTLLYLLHLLSPMGRQAIKDYLMEHIASEAPEARNLLDAINMFERTMGQLERMSDEERKRLGLPPKGA